MRVGDRTFFSGFLAGLRASRAQAAEAVSQLADGKRVRRASDDPSGAQATMLLRARLARVQAYDRAGQAARADLATIDRVLGEAIALVSEARAEGLAGASFPFGEANAIHAQRIEAIRAQLLALANTAQSGRYLFAGTATQAAPFAADGTYNGDEAEVQVPLDDGQSVGATLVGRRVFSEATDLFAKLDELAQALRDNRTQDAAAVLPELQQALERLVEVRADVGLRLRALEEAELRRADEAELWMRRIAEVEDAELERVVTDLQLATTASEALARAAARVLGRSLFDVLG